MLFRYLILSFCILIFFFILSQYIVMKRLKGQFCPKIFFLKEKIYNSSYQQDVGENDRDANLLTDITKLHQALMGPIHSKVKLETLKTFRFNVNLISHVKRNIFLNKKVDNIASMKKHFDKKSEKNRIVTPPKKNTTNLIYNRINKSGSASILALLGGLSVSNKFHLIGYGQPMIRYFLFHQQQKLANMLCDDTQGPLLYTRHIYFMDLSKFGCDIKYINMVSFIAIK